MEARRAETRLRLRALHDSPTAHSRGDAPNARKRHYGTSRAKPSLGMLKRLCYNYKWLKSILLAAVVKLRERMKEELTQIRSLLDTLESSLSKDTNLALTPFSGLELPDIIKDVVDLIFPHIGPYEAAFYIYLLRKSIIGSGDPYIRIGTRPLQTGVIQSAYAGTTVGSKKTISQISLAKVRDTLGNLEEFGAIRKENEPNRDGTLYRIILPEEINLCQEYRHTLETSIANTNSGDLSPDYYNVRENRIKVYERDDYKCKYCGKQLTRFTTTIDHLTPIAKGGDNSFENLVTACLDCNSRKNVKPVGDFLVGRS